MSDSDTRAKWFYTHAWYFYYITISWYTALAPPRRNGDHKLKPNALIEHKISNLIRRKTYYSRGSLHDLYRSNDRFRCTQNASNILVYYCFRYLFDFRPTSVTLQRTRSLVVVPVWYNVRNTLLINDITIQLYFILSSSFLKYIFNFFFYLDVDFRTRHIVDGRALCYHWGQGLIGVWMFFGDRSKHSWVLWKFVS